MSVLEDVSLILRNAPGAKFNLQDMYHFIDKDIRLRLLDGLGFLMKSKQEWTLLYENTPNELEILFEYFNAIMYQEIWQDLCHQGTYWPQSSKYMDCCQHHPEKQHSCRTSNGCVFDF